MADSVLQRVLDVLRRRAVALGVATGVGWSLVTWLVLMLLAMWLDVFLDLTSGMRIGLSLAAFLGAICVVARSGKSVRRAVQVRTLARRLDGAGGAGGRILSGVDLMLSRAGGSPLTAGLAQIAVGQAAELAVSVAPARAVSAHPARRSGVVFLSFCGAVFLLALATPRLATVQWLRFSDPYGDHPPYSRLTFTVEPGDTSVIYGDGLDVRVAVGGAPVDRLELVMHDEQASDEQTLPMFLEPSGRWRTTLASVTQPSRYFVHARGARSHRYEIDVVTVPRLENVAFRIVPPDYTQQPAYEGPLPKGGIAGLPGTNVQFRATSNRPLAGGDGGLIGEDGVCPLDLRPAGADSCEVAAQFSIDKPGKLHFTVRDIAGQSSRDDFSASISVLSDQRPFVRILEPPTASFATPDVALPVRVAAEDDYGVAHVQLFRSLNDSRPLPVQMPLSGNTATREQPVEKLPLSSYRLKPGDVIKLFARVEDNDPTGAKGSESPVVQVRIISQEDFEQLIRVRQGLEVLLSKYQQAERRIERLGEEMRKLQEELAAQPPDSELAADLRQKLRELAEQMARDADEIRKAADFDLPYDVDAALSKELTRLAGQLSQMAGQVATLGQPGERKAGPTAEQLAKLREQLAQRGQKYRQEVTEPLEYLAAIYPLKEDEARFVNLYERQRELTERMASLRGHDGEDDPQLKARMRDLQAEQQSIRDDLLTLIDDVENHARRLPEDPKLEKLRKTAEEFAQALRESDAAPAMLDAETSLARFAGTRAHEQAAKAAAILESFLSKCNGMGEEGGQCLAFQPSLNSCLGNSVQQMLAEGGLGTGMGAGGGSGYSARRNSMNNVGLYGSLPAMSASDLRGGATQGAPGASVAGDAGQAADFQSAQISATGTFQASGSAGAHVPIRYRQRVGAYFRRVADELDTEERR